MAGKKKEEGKEYKGWGGKREGAGGKKGQVNVGHNGGRKPPTALKRQRNVYVTEEEFEALKDYLWNVLRKDAPQTNRKHKNDSKQGDQS